MINKHFLLLPLFLLPISGCSCENNLSSVMNMNARDIRYVKIISSLQVSAIQGMMDESKFSGFYRSINVEYEECEPWEYDIQSEVLKIFLVGIKDADKWLYVYLLPTNYIYLFTNRGWFISCDMVNIPTKYFY